MSFLFLSLLMHIAQIIWKYKNNFRKTFSGISKSLTFLFNYIW